MKLFFFILIPFLGYSQIDITSLNLNQFDKTQAIVFQNDIRSFYDLNPYTIDDSLSIIAQKWANHLAKIDDLEISDDPYGESVFQIGKEYLDNFNKNVYMEASISWLLTKGEDEESPFFQIISNTASKIGLGVSKNDERYYVVAKYDSIY